MVMPSTAPLTSQIWLDAVWPAEFSTTRHTGASKLYLSDPAARKLAEFFESKGLAALRQDFIQQGYDGSIKP